MLPSTTSSHYLTTNHDIITLHDDTYTPTTTIPSIKRDCSVSHRAFIKFHFTPVHDNNTISSSKRIKSAFFGRKSPTLSQGFEDEIMSVGYFIEANNGKAQSTIAFFVIWAYGNLCLSLTLIASMPHCFMLFNPRYLFLLVTFWLHCSIALLLFSPYCYS